MPQPRLYPAGKVAATPGALEALTAANTLPSEYLHRHLSGDWGELCEEDKELNDEAVREGCRTMSAYTLPTGVKIWIITEADRSVTTFLLPDEY